MYSCIHERTELRWRNRAAGLIGRQCLECGARVGNWVSHATVDGAEGLSDWAAVDVVGSAPNRVGMVGPEDRDSQPRYVDLDAYDAYLGSPEWRYVRAKVWKRAGGVCEGCLTCAATDVHHLTYRNLFAEFMFQLVALCRGCHDRIHAPTALGGDE